MSAKETKKPGFSKGGFGRRVDFGSYKKSDNPDVIFGRDFDDEAMKLVEYCKQCLAGTEKELMDIIDSK